MSDILVVKQVPDGMKTIEARKPGATHSRSMNNEPLFISTRDNERREHVGPPTKRIFDVMRTLEEFSKLSVSNADASDKMLYDAQGLPE